MRLTRRQYKETRSVFHADPIFPIHATTVLTRRNEPCRCGSGKKFKRCHGRNIMVRLRDEPGQGGLVVFNIGPREFNR